MIESGKPRAPSGVTRVRDRAAAQGAAHLDRAHASSQRLGFSSLPRAVLALRMLGPGIWAKVWLRPAGGGQRDDGSRGSAVMAVVCISLIYGCLMLLKTALTVHLLAAAYRRVGKADAAEDNHKYSESESEAQLSPTSPRVSGHLRSTYIESGPSSAGLAEAKLQLGQLANMPMGL